MGKKKKIRKLEEKIDRLERRVDQLERPSTSPGTLPAPLDNPRPTPATPFYGGNDRCPVCKLAYKDMGMYACNHDLCPNRITVTCKEGDDE